MTKFYAALLGSVLLATPAMAADSPFNGTWKGDAKSGVVEAKPDEFTIKDGTYDCKTCLPPYTTKVDGKYHAVAGRPYWDETAVTIVDPATVKTEMRKGGKSVAENVRTVSADGNTLTVTSRNTANATGAPVTQSAVLTRVGAPVPGAHRVSGAWKIDPKQSEMSDNAVTMTLKVDGDNLHLKSGIGETLDAKLGGDYALNVGDPGKTLTKARLIAPNTLELTDMRDGKVIQATTYVVAADGKALDATWTDPRDGSKGTFRAAKQ